MINWWIEGFRGTPLSDKLICTVAWSTVFRSFTYCFVSFDSGAVLRLVFQTTNCDPETRRFFWLPQRRNQELAVNSRIRGKSPTVFWGLWGLAVPDPFFPEWSFFSTLSGGLKGKTTCLQAWGSRWSIWINTLWWFRAPKRIEVKTVKIQPTWDLIFVKTVAEPTASKTFQSSEQCEDFFSVKRWLGRSHWPLSFWGSVCKK